MYDALNRLTEVIPTNHSMPEVVYTYDSQNRRASKSVFYWNFAAGTAGAWSTDPESITDYVYDGSELVAEVDGFTGGLEKSYTWDPTREGGVGGLLSVSTYGWSSYGYSYWTGTYLPVANSHGDIVSLIDQSSGAVVETYMYSAYGVRTASNSAMDVCPFGWDGYYFDKDVNLDFAPINPTPWSAELGTALIRDPLGEASSPGAQVRFDGDPINHIDKTGMEPAPIGMPVDNMPSRNFSGNPVAGRIGITGASKGMPSPSAGSLMLVAGGIASAINAPGTFKANELALRASLVTDIDSFVKSGQLDGQLANQLKSKLYFPGAPVPGFEGPITVGGQIFPTNGGVMLGDDWKVEFVDALAQTVANNNLKNIDNYLAYRAADKNVEDAKERSKNTEGWLYYESPDTVVDKKTGLTYTRGIEVFGLLTKTFVDQYRSPSDPPDSLKKTWPGWDGKTYDRGHMAGAQLGGSNTDLGNFVMIPKSINNPDMLRFENAVAAAVSAGANVKFWVYAEYSDDRDPVPTVVYMMAKGNGAFAKEVRIIVQPEKFRDFAKSMFR